MVPPWDIKWPIKYTWPYRNHKPYLRPQQLQSAPVNHSAGLLLAAGQSWGTHLHLPLGQPLFSGPLANVIGVTSLEGYSGHGPLTKADLPTNSPSQPASTSLFKVLKKKKVLASRFLSIWIRYKLGMYLFTRPCPAMFWVIKVFFFLFLK